MRLTVNGAAYDWPDAVPGAATAQALIDRLGLSDAKVATALNGDFLPAGLRARTMLSPGDAVEVVAPMQGG